MNNPAVKPDPKDKLYVTDAEIIRILGVPEKVARQAIRALDQNRNSQFPKKQALWGDRRYWPAVKLWLDRTGGLKMEASPEARP